MKNHTMIEKLCKASEKDYSNPYQAILWPDSISKEEWYMSPELISIYGTETFEKMPEYEKKRLSFYEAVNFFSLNIHGEKALIEGLAKRLYRRNSEASPYLHHFLDEENKHMVYFGTFCQKYAGKIYQDKKVTFSREFEKGEEDFLFFTKVLIFEEIVDIYNAKMAKDEKVSALARRINLLHHEDESRHLVFGRLAVKDLFDNYSSKWTSETLNYVKNYVSDYFSATWSEYYNLEVYADAGIANASEIREKVLASDSARGHRKLISAHAIKFLIENKIIDKEPAL